MRRKEARKKRRRKGAGVSDIDCREPGLGGSFQLRQRSEHKHAVERMVIMRLSLKEWPWSAGLRRGGLLALNTGNYYKALPIVPRLNNDYYHFQTLELYLR